MKIIRDFTDWFFNRQKKWVMSLAEFEHWTNLKWNPNKFLYEWGDIKITQELVWDAQKREDLEGLARALIKQYLNIYWQLITKQPFPLHPKKEEER